MLSTYLRKIYYRIRVVATPASIFFSPSYYLKNHPDLAEAKTDPYEHYVKHGYKEKRRGNEYLLVRLKTFARANLAKKFPHLFILLHGAYSKIKSLNKIFIKNKIFVASNGFKDIAQKLDPLKKTILIVSHEGTKTGAPILSYNLIKNFSAKYNVIALFLDTGPIVFACGKLKNITVLVYPEAKNSYPVCDYIIDKIVSAVPLYFAITNSIQSRFVLNGLIKHNVANISLVHEFVANTRPITDLRESLVLSGKTVFSSTLVRDNAVQNFPDLRNISFEIIPQGLCKLPENEQTNAEQNQKIEKLLRPDGFPSDGKVIIGMGYIQYRKGPDLFIDAVAKIRKQLPDVPLRFVWVGGGYNPDDTLYTVFLSDQAQRFGVCKDLFFIGEVDDLSLVYKSADLLLLTSRLDPLPNIAVDTLTAGLPIVCFDKTTGVADILRDNNLHEFCVADYMDIKEMANKAVKLISSPELYQDVSEKSKALAAKTFSMQDYIEKLDRLAINEIEFLNQELMDIKTILESGLTNLHYYLGPQIYLHHKKMDVIFPIILRNVRFCRFHQNLPGDALLVRKFLPGFDPGIYFEQHGISSECIHPFADYLRMNQPQGPWNTKLITDKNQVKTIPSNVRIGLHIHVYYPDLFGSMVAALKKNKLRPDLLISVVNQAAKEVVEAVLHDYTGGKVYVHIVPNKGRDIGPFLTEFREKIKKEYDIIGHLHTKKSVLIEESIGPQWYQFLIQNLLGGSCENMADIILGEMCADPNIGMVFPDDPHLVGWTENKTLMFPYIKKLGLNVQYENFSFPVGTMFWARVKAIEPLFDLNLAWEDYPLEPVPIDGTILHGLERLFGLIVPHTGYEIACTYVDGVSR